MIPQSEGKIFLAEERGHNEMDWYRSYNTFNFGNFYNEHKFPFESLYVLNEDTLAGGKKISMLIEDDSCIVLLPVVGAINFKDSTGNVGTLEAGEAQMLQVYKGTTLEINNPYADELINFIQIWIKMPGLQQASAQLFSFDLEQQNNELLPLFSAENDTIKTASPRGVIGQFSGRAEAVFEKQYIDSAIFAYVIEGNVEVAHRLMNPRDGLGLWNIGEAELEALSSSAIIILLEIPLIKTVS